MIVREKEDRSPLTFPLVYHKIFEISSIVYQNLTVYRFDVKVIYVGETASFYTLTNLRLCLSCTEITKSSNRIFIKTIPKNKA